MLRSTGHLFQPDVLRLGPMPEAIARPAAAPTPPTMEFDLIGRIEHNAADLLSDGRPARLDGFQDRAAKRV